MSALSRPTRPAPRSLRAAAAWITTVRHARLARAAAAAFLAFALIAATQQMTANADDARLGDHDCVGDHRPGRRRRDAALGARRVARAPLDHSS